jgi:hypothetical protein
MANVLLVSGAVLLIAASVLGVVSLGLIRVGEATTRKRSEAATSSALHALDHGESLDEVARVLARESRLPSLVAVRVMATVARISPEDALTAIRPYLTVRQLDVIDRMPTKRFNEATRHRSMP